MPTLANLIVKKYDGTTDTTYTAVMPAGGDGSPAVWKNQTVGTTPGQQPEFRFTARGRSKKGVPYRSVTGTYKYQKAVSNTSTGELTLSDGVTVVCSVDVNQTMSASDINEAVYQSLNLLASAAIKAAARDGYSFN